MVYKNIYFIKRADIDDVPSIKMLFWKVFRKKVTKKYLEKKYNTSHLGIDYICTIAYFNSKAVAFYGALPQSFICRGQELKVAHAGDSITLPEHQRKGLHFQLAKEAYKVMQENDIKFVYAFHSKKTYLSTKKLGWKKHKRMLRFHIKTHSLPIAKLVNKFDFNNVYDIFCNEKLSEDAYLKLRLIGQDKFCQAITHDYINYKNSFNNHYCLEIDDCVFWVKIQAVLHVGFFYAPSEIAFDTAIKKLKRKAFYLGVDELLFQVDSDSMMAQQLRSVAEPKDSWLVGYLDFQQDINLNNFIFSYSDLDTF